MREAGMDWNDSIWIVFVKERFVAVGILGALMTLYAFLPFFIMITIIGMIILGFSLAIHHQEHDSITTNLMQFIVISAFVIITIGKLASYEYIKNDIRVDQNSTYAYSKNSEGYTVHVLDGNKVRYSFKSNDAEFIKLDKLNVKIVDENSVFDHEATRSYAIINSKEK